MTDPLTPDRGDPDRSETAAAPPTAPPPGATAAEAFGALVELMRILRSPTGCPWDREQTLESLKPFVLEEAHEVIDAIERGDLDELRGEIGDLVFEGVFLAQLCADAGHFSIVDALNHVRAKLVRRHPHVFAPDADTAGVTTPQAVKGKWEEIKAAEREQSGRARAGIFDGIPKTLPALLAAYEISMRAGSVGFDWPDAPAVAEKVDEELMELREAMASGDRRHVEEELGDMLFAMSSLSRKLGIEPEAALRAANRKFMRRFAAMQARLAGTPADTATLPQMEAAWQDVKQTERE